MTGITPWQLAGWTMLHFLWVGGAIGILAAMGRRAIRDAAPELRHAAAVLSLALLVLAPGAIAWRLGHAGRVERPFPESGQTPLADSAVVRQTAEESPRPAQLDQGVAPIPRTAAPAAGIAHEMTPRPLRLAARLDALASWLPWFWLAGSPMTFTWLALGLAGAERLRRRSVVLTDGELPQTCRRLAEALGIARIVAVAVCDRIAAPVLVGVIRPLILLPASALGSWSPEQLEMVLLHELAHLRRWDNLINLVQRLVESVLFFQPAVWLVSGWLRQEREHCCDRIVVTHTGRARAYAETLLALAAPEPDRAPRAAVAMTHNHLVVRIRQILVPREEHPMKLSRSLIVAVGAAVVAPAFWIAARAQTQPSQKAQTSQNAAPVSGQAVPAKPQDEKAAKPPVVIQGKSLVDWIAALKDRDPAVRKRAVEVLGTVTGDQAGGLWSEMQTAIQTTLFSDKVPEVRRAAALVADDFKFANDPATKKRFDEERKRAVAPTLTPLRLVDAQGGPVTGAVVSHYFSRDCDRESSFTVPESIESRTSGAQGQVTLKLEIRGHLDGVGVFAIRQDQGRPLVGLRKVTRAEIGKPITIAMHPACRVRLRVECPGFRELSEKYHAELGGAGWWRAAYVMLGDDNQAPRPLFTSSSTGELEFLLPPGQFTIRAYGSNTVHGNKRQITIEPGHRVLSLGTIEVAPEPAVKRGIFRGFWRSVRRDPQAELNGHADGKNVVFRHPKRGTTPKGEARGIQDLAFSPDGKLLATAHWYNADPGEVKLWDTATGKLVASLPAPVKDGGVLELAFSPDGKSLAGSVGPLARPQPPGVIVLWDVAGRRELRTLHGHTARIAALAFSPDGKVLASGGEDKTVRFWEVATRREIHRIESNSGWVRSAAYSPDGKSLAIGAGLTVKLWDVTGNRLRAMLEPDGFWVHSIAFASDGKTLAAAGATADAGGHVRQSQVRLYDLTRDPPARRAELTLDFNGPVRADVERSYFSDVAFTPDGRRVAAVVMQTVVIWDAATGSEQDSLDRRSGSADRLAVTPDGRWLAVTEVWPPNVSILEIGSLAR